MIKKAVSIISVAAISILFQACSMDSANISLPKPKSKKKIVTIVDMQYQIYNKDDFVKDYSSSFLQNLLYALKKEDVVLSFDEDYFDYKFPRKIEYESFYDLFDYAADKNIVNKIVFDKGYLYPDRLKSIKIDYAIYKYNSVDKYLRGKYIDSLITIYPGYYSFSNLKMDLEKKGYHIIKDFKEDIPIVIEQSEMKMSFADLVSKIRKSAKSYDIDVKVKYDFLNDTFLFTKKIPVYKFSPFKYYVAKNILDTSSRVPPYVANKNEYTISGDFDMENMLSMGKYSLGNRVYRNFAFLICPDDSEECILTYEGFKPKNRYSIEVLNMANVRNYVFYEAREGEDGVDYKISVIRGNSPSGKTGKYTIYFY